MNILRAVQSIDAGILLFIQEHIRGPVLNAVMIFFTTVGNAGIVWIALSIILMFFRKHRKLGFSILVCIAAAWLVNDGVIKNIVCRPRPFTVVDGLEILVSRPSSFSFPSGHACSSFCAAFVITRFRGKKGALIYIVSALIAFSRIYVGVHYPSDIITGAIIGTMSGAIFTWIIIKHLNKPVSRLLRTPEGK